MTKGRKYTIRNNIFYEWSKNKEKVEGKTCLKCGEKTRFEKLVKCGHEYLVCGCTPVNYNPSWMTTFEKVAWCPICGVKVEFGKEVETKFREKAKTAFLIKP